MKHTYKITGMSCHGCKTNVETSLNNLKEITKVEANLDTNEVIVEMTSHVSIEALQERLLKSGLHYTIEMPEQNKSDEYYCTMLCEGDKT